MCEGETQELRDTDVLWLERPSRKWPFTETPGVREGQEAYEKVGDPRTRRPEVQETCVSCSQGCKIPPVLDRLLHNAGASSLIFDKHKSAETILETLGFVWLVMV